MKEQIKKYVLSVMIGTMFLGSSNVFANENYDEELSQMGSNEINISLLIGETVTEGITEQDIPYGVEVMKFDTVEERDQFLEQMKKDLLVGEWFLEDVSRDRSIRTLRADQRSSGPFSVSLYVQYTSSGSHVTWADAFTTLTGVTFSVGWNQTAAHARIVSNGRDISATGNGELINYFWVSGLLEISRTHISLSGFLTIYG